MKTKCRVHFDLLLMAFFIRIHKPNGKKWVVMDDFFPPDSQTNMEEKCSVSKLWKEEKTSKHLSYGERIILLWARENYDIFLLTTASSQFAAHFIFIKQFNGAKHICRWAVGWAVCGFFLISPINCLLHSSKFQWNLIFDGINGRKLSSLSFKMPQNHEQNAKFVHEMR